MKIKLFFLAYVSGFMLLLGLFFVAHGGDEAPDSVIDSSNSIAIKHASNLAPNLSVSD